MPRPRPRAAAAAVLALSAALALAACSGDQPDDATPEPEPTTAISTLTPITPPPKPPATGRLLADMRQSSRDVALGRMEVWVDNDTVRDVTPARLTYTDPRLRAPLPGTRLRLIPSRSERGYPLYLPARPRCGTTAPAGSGRLQVTRGGRSVTLPVEDSTDVVGRYVATRCQELAVARVAELSWDDTVASTGEPGSTGTLVLHVRPTGLPGHRLTIETVTGTPVLTAAGAAYWSPDLTVAGDGEEQSVELEVMPARCDPHVFMESGGATAFRITLRVDGEEGQLVLRMDPAGAAAAIGFARDSCDLGD